MVIVAKRIRELRKEHKMSQIELAEKCMVKQSCISKWERGATLPELECIVLLAKIFSVSTDYLLGVTDY